MGAAPVTMTRTRPPKDSCRQQGHVRERLRTTAGSRQNPYLHFVEDQFVPDAVLPDDALPHFSVLPVHSEVQQPFLEGRARPALNLSDKQEGCRTGL